MSNEKAVYERSTSKSIYLNLAINAIKKLRDEIGAVKQTACKNPKALSHAAMLEGKAATRCTFTLNRSGGPKKELTKIEGLC